MASDDLAASGRPSIPMASADLEHPAEAFARLVYGRLDRTHPSPAITVTQRVD